MGPTPSVPFMSQGLGIKGFLLLGRQLAVKHLDGVAALTHVSLTLSLHGLHAIDTLRRGELVESCAIRALLAVPSGWLHGCSVACPCPFLSGRELEFGFELIHAFGVVFGHALGTHFRILVSAPVSSRPP